MRWRIQPRESARCTGGHRGCTGDAATHRADRSTDRREEPRMLDIVLIATTVAFFAVSLAYVRGCDVL